MSAVRLREIAELNPRHGRDVSADTAVSFLGMADVSESGTTGLGTSKKYGEVKRGYTPFLHGDVLVAKITPCFENGKIAQAILSHAIGAGSTEFHVVRGVPERVEQRYLLHFLRQPRVRQEGELCMTGSGGQRRVPQRYLADLTVPLPTLAEQGRVVEVLDQVDFLRAQRRNSFVLLGDLIKSIFIDMFGDPVVNTAGWRTKRLGSVGTLDRGVSKHRPRNDPVLLGGEYPLIQTGDVAGSQGYITEYHSTYSDVGLSQSRIWPAGTLCITIAANIAKTGILQFDACFPDSVVGFTADPHTVEYVRVWLSFLQATLEAAAPASAQKNINLATLRELPIPMPPSDLVRRFSERVKAAAEQKQAYLAQLATLDELFTSLQQRAFNGTLWQDRAA